jgi:hypothetical protein
MQAVTKKRPSAGGSLIMKLSFIPVAALMLTTSFVHAEQFTIAGFTFDQASSVTSVAIVEGSATLEDHSNKNFGKYTEEYLRSPTVTVNEFAKFDRTRTLGCLLGRSAKGTTARHINLTSSPATRTTLELTWGAQGLPNLKGADFYIYESGNPDVFAVAVRKAGSTEFSPYFYKGFSRDDKLHAANASAYDLSDFGLVDGDVCSAIRIRNVWATNTKAGSDKVNNESGEGMILSPSHPDYKNGFPLRMKKAGVQVSSEDVDPDLLYVAGRHPLVALKMKTQQPEAATKEPAKEAVASSEKK